ncbi:MAG: glycosyltransferase family 4 protein [Candidatus Bathyarchaeia archaeon]|jgi:glycosyltransferase involved in cell wall biosynthesis
MRVLYLVHQFFPKHYTGTERFTLSLAHQVSRMGHLPTVITYERDSRIEGFSPISEDILIKQYTYQGVNVICFAHSKQPPNLEMFDSSIEKAFNKLDIKCDIVHLCHPMWLSSIAKECKQRSIPVVFTITDAWLLCPRSLVDVHFKLCDGPKRGKKCITNCNLHRKIANRYQEALSLFNSVDELTTSSKFTASLFKRNGWKRRVRLVGHSIDYNYVRKTHNDREASVSFGYMGTIDWHKGLHVLINAFKKVKASNVKLNVYGSLRDNPQYGNDIYQTAKDDPRIRFKGPFDIVNSADVMNNISALVVPSVYYDNYPLVTLMSLAYNTPVIGSDIGGIPEIISDGKNGFLFKPGSSEELASLIERIAAKPEILKRLRENIVSPRRVEEEALDYENIYRKLTTQFFPLPESEHRGESR